MTTTEYNNTAKLYTAVFISLLHHQGHLEEVDPYVYTDFNSVETCKKHTESVTRVMEEADTSFTLEMYDRCFTPVDIYQCVKHPQELSPKIELHEFPALQCIITF